MCNVKIESGTYHFPDFKLPSESRARTSISRSSASKDSKRRSRRSPRPTLHFPTSCSSKYRARLDYEMEVIKTTGFAGYFLIVSDFIGFAKSHDIPVGPGRGSAAGSLVAYCLDITNIDPIKYDLHLREVSQPGTDQHARYRRRLLHRRTGARHRVRDGAIRQGQRRPDHHLRDHEVEGGGQGRGAGPRHPLSPM